MALTQGLIDSYWQKYNQRRALTGLPSGYQEQRGMLDPMLEYGLRDAQAQRDYGLKVPSDGYAASGTERCGTGGYGVRCSADGRVAGNGITHQQGVEQSGGEQRHDADSTCMGQGAGGGGMQLPAGVGSGALPLRVRFRYLVSGAPVLQAQTTFPAARWRRAGAGAAGLGSGISPAAGVAAAAVAVAVRYGQDAITCAEQDRYAERRQGVAHMVAFLVRWWRDRRS